MMIMLHLSNRLFNRGQAQRRFFAPESLNITDICGFSALPKQKTIRRCAHSELISVYLDCKFKTAKHKGNRIDTGFPVLTRLSTLAPPGGICRLQCRLTACGMTAAPLLAKKVPPALFLNAQTLSGSNLESAGIFLFIFLFVLYTKIQILKHYLNNWPCMAKFVLHFVLHTSKNNCF